MDADTIDMLSTISQEVFRVRLADFLERVSWGQGEALSPADRSDIVNLAIQDCAWLEICREGDVVSMAVLRLVALDLVNDPAYRDAVIEQIPNPVHRTGAYLGEIAYHMTPSDQVAFYGKVNFWREFVKGEIQPHAQTP